MNHSRVRKSSMLLPSYILDQKHTHLIPFTPRHLRPLTLSSVKEKKKNNPVLCHNHIFECNANQETQTSYVLGRKFVGSKHGDVSATQ